VFEKMTFDMLEAAKRAESLVNRFAANITEDAQRLLSMDAPLTSPLTDQAQIEAVRRIRSQVQDFEKQLADVHQAILTAAQAISWTWVLPGDIETELKRVQDTAKPPAAKT
jgi:hypothetical protein